MQPLRCGPLLAAAGLLVFMAATPADAVHFYRGPGAGCTPSDGELTDQPANAPVATTVLMLHNAFLDTSTGTPVTLIKAGQAVRWVWNSSHCHSVLDRATPQNFYSGYHYPVSVPEWPAQVPILGGTPTPQAVPGFFEYPVFDLTPTMSFVHTFNTPGTYAYICEHHALIGMQGVVVVQ